jgi:hypothetical protein
MPCVVPGIPTQTLFDPKENYPPGVLRSVTVQVPGTGEFLDIQFFPECQEIVFAVDNRTSDTSSLRDKRMGWWNCSRIDRAEDSWSLDEISSEKTKWKNGKLQVERDRNKCQLLKDDIAKIEEMLKWQAEDLKNVCYEKEVNTHEIDEDMETWLNIHSFTEEEEEFFEKEIIDMNLHHLRSSSGPPTGYYYMNVNYNSNSGLPEKRACWRTEEWCPELGRLELMRVPEDYGCFSTFNPKFKPFGIQWPCEIVDKTEGECNEKRFSGLQSCGSWMEWMIDNEGRFVANGIVKKFIPFRVNNPLWGCIVKSEYGDCIVPEYLVTKNKLKVGDEVKLLCRDNDRGSVPLKCSKVIKSGPGSCDEFASCGWY